MMSDNFYFFISFIVGLVVLPLMKNFSERKRMFIDIAEGDSLKIHRAPKSLLGGMAMVASFSVGLLFIQGSFFTITTVLLGAMLIFGIGLYDDLKWKHVSQIKPLVKFAILILGSLIPAALLYWGGISFNVIPFAIVAIIATFIYIFVVINSINYQDGMDGLAGGLTGISLFGFIILSVMLQNTLVLLMALVALGGVLAFLCFNLPPAKIFMGDSGAYFLGFVLSVVALSFSKQYNIMSIIAPIFVIGLPIADGVFTNLRRLANGKSIFFGDRAHFYDRLLQKGFSPRKTLFICYSLQCVFVLLGLIIYSYV